MKVFINGTSIGFSPAAGTTLEKSILALLRDYDDKNRGDLLTIELDPGDLPGITEISAKPECVDAFRNLAERINKQWTQKTQNWSTMEEGFGTPLPLPDPRDIKVEVYYVTELKNDNVILGPPVIQVLTKRWLGLTPHPGGGYRVDAFCIPATP